MSYSVRFVDLEDEDCSTLVILRNGQEINRYCDGGEPEDSSFCRDWSWVPTALEEAYKFGVEDGKKMTEEK
jgi:hypothetical protein